MPNGTRKLARVRLAAIATSALAAAGLGLSATPASAAGSVWDRVAACESGGNWSIATGNGYYGGLQFSASTWRGYGGGAYASTANKASKAQQIAIAQRVLAGQGPGAWPVCSRKAGLTRANGGASSAASAAAATTATPNATKKATSAKTTKATSGKKYTVKSGDTLFRIARSHGVSGGYRALAAANGISNPSVIRVGQVLTLP